jgi:hypothetical protein
MPSTSQPPPSYPLAACVALLFTLETETLRAPPSHAPSLSVFCAQVRRVAPGEVVTRHGRRVAAAAVLCAGSLLASSPSSAPPRVLPVGHVLGAQELFFPNQGCEVSARCDEEAAEGGLVSERGRMGTSESLGDGRET